MSTTNAKSNQKQNENDGGHINMTCKTTHTHTQVLE